MNPSPARPADPTAPPATDRPGAPPFTGLTPDTVLDSLDAVGLRGDGRLIQLNSYENRVFQVFLEDGRVVVAKFYRPGRWSDTQILEEHVLAADLAAEECPVVAPWPLAVDGNTRLSARLCVGDAADSAGAKAATSTLVEVDTDGSPYRFAVAERRAGRPPELEAPGTLEWIGRLIGRMHLVGARRSFKHRATLSVAGIGRASRDWLLASGLIPPDAESLWRDAVDPVLDLAEEAFDSAAPLTSMRLHGDCHTGNILWTDAGPHFVDLDDCLTGPAMQDLWMLLSGDKTIARTEMNAVLSGYEQFREFDDREMALIEPLRSLRMIHHSAWIARRWSDPAFPVAFPWFEGTSYWQQQAQQLREQRHAMSPSGS